MQAKHRWISGILVIVVLLVAAGESRAITRRDDRADSLYTDLANNIHAYGGMVSGSGWIGSGTLISPNWVLTAAHVVSGTAVSFQTSAGTVTIDQQVQHPSYPTNSYFDIGLAHLSSPITTIAPVKLYDLSYGDEPGQECIITGAGSTGTGLTGQQGGTAGTRRAAQTYVYANASAWGWGSERLLTWFRSPTGGAADLEGGSTQGDSGGGLLLQAEGEWTVAGALSEAWWGGSGGDTIGKYDTGGVFVRSAPLNAWITGIATDAMVIPEPATVGLLLFGSSFLVLPRRSRRPVEFV